MCLDEGHKIRNPDTEVTASSSYTCTFTCNYDSLIRVDNEDRQDAALLPPPGALWHAHPEHARRAVVAVRLHLSGQTR